MLRGKERKKRKNSYADLNRGKWIRFIHIKDQQQGEKNSGKPNNGINVEKYNRFKKLKL